MLLSRSESHKNIDKDIDFINEYDMSIFYGFTLLQTLSTIIGSAVNTSFRGFSIMTLNSIIMVVFDIIVILINSRLKKPLLGSWVVTAAHGLYQFPVMLFFSGPTVMVYPVIIITMITFQSRYFIMCLRS